MKYIFYGRHEITDYRPHVADYYGAKVPSLGAWTRTASYEEIYRKDNVHAKIEKGQWLDINGESVCITSIEYDIVDDSYKCYTNKVLSRKDNNMSKEDAERQLEAERNKGVSGFIRGLFGL